MQKSILISGGTGMIGKKLTKALVMKGYHVMILTRGKDEGRGQPFLPSQVSYYGWNPANKQIEPEAIRKADHIIHLAGANVAEKRWTEKRKKEIIESRTQTADLLINSAREIPNKIKSFISASAIGWYGPDPATPNPRPFTEEAPAYKDFLGETCLAWENAVQQAEQLNIRTVSLRTGIVLDPDGGALKEFIRPLKLGVASILSTGKQIMSWIHVDDLVNMYIYALENERLSGSYNAVAPHPVSNKDLVLTLAHERNGKKFMAAHVPTFILKAMLGEMSIEVLKSATVSSSKIESTGFKFLYPEIEVAIAHVVHK